MSLAQIKNILRKKSLQNRLCRRMAAFRRACSLVYSFDIHRVMRTVRPMWSRCLQRHQSLISNNKFIPKTLLTRVMLLIALLLVAGQWTSLQIFEYFEREPRAEAAALQAVTVVDYSKAALIAAQDNMRFALLAELSNKEGIRIYYAGFMEDIEALPSDSPYIQLVAKKIRQRLGENTIVTLNHYGIEGLWVSFNIGVDDFWVFIPRLHFEQPFPWQWLGWGAVVVILSLLGAYLLATRINHPLQLLVSVANHLRRGETPPKLPEDSVAELGAVNSAVNQMVDALTRLDKERWLILAGVSHDIRTPLARLRLATEMLASESNLTLKEGMIQDIADIDSIIHQFLDFVRGVEGESSQYLSLASLLSALVERQLRAGRNLIIHSAPWHESFMLSVRVLAMQRLLDNLVGNAYIHGKPPVEVRCQLEPEQVTIAVLDHGCGVPDSQTQVLLRPFERMDSARSNASGSGLGLAIAERIAKLHNGKLELKNIATGGCEAKLILPITYHTHP